MSFFKSASKYARRRISATQAPVVCCAGIDNDLAPIDSGIRGAARELLSATEPEVLIEGPAGTGKTVSGLFAAAYKMMHEQPGSRQVLIRKARASITPMLDEFERYVLPPSHPERGRIAPGNRTRYSHPNGSTLYLGGMDKLDKVFGNSWDRVLITELNELTLPEYEGLTTRLRSRQNAQPQILSDVNPQHRQHWINIRAGVPGGPPPLMRRLVAKLEDNPLWHDGNDWTPAGRKYVEKLDRLTGARYKRLRLGLWASAEGAVYEGLDDAIHWVDAAQVKVQDHWKRYWVSDFGFTNPFVWQEWAMDEDGRLYRVQEIYQSRLLVEDAARMILAATANSPRPVAWICDHDGEDRHTLERHTGIQTIPAMKAVLAGIDAVNSRLRVEGDGKPRLMFVRGARIHAADERLLDARLPASTDEEIYDYEWARTPAGSNKDEPVKKNDHGCDCVRYLVAHVDGVGVEQVIQDYSGVRAVGAARSF